VGRDLSPTPKGLQVVAMLGDHPLTSPEMTGEWEKRLRDIELGSADRGAFMEGIVAFTRETVEKILALETDDLRPERVELGPCPRCGAATGNLIRENSKAFGCTSWKSATQTGCGFVLFKRVAGRTITPEIARQLLQDGRTRDVLTGFRGKSGRPFRARLLMADDGHVSLDLPARPGKDGEPPPPPGPPPRRPPRPAAPPAADGSAPAAAAEVAPGPPVDPPEMVPGFDLAAWLASHHLEVVDKRAKGGALWVVSGPARPPALAALASVGHRFIFKAEGGRATRSRPGWYLRAPEAAPK
jgi:DNA topoisomerase-3